MAKEPTYENLLKKIESLEAENERLKDVEARLIDREETLTAFLNASTESMILSDREGKILAINETAAMRLGKKVEDLIGVKIEDIVPAEIDISRKKTVERIFESGNPVKVQDERDGRIFDTSIFPVFDEDRKVKAVASFGRDITRSLKEEEERKKIEDQLRQSQKMEVIGTLASGVAHDLNNILSGIVSYPEILLMELPEDSPLKKPINTIKKSGEKAAVIIQDLLTLARREVPLFQIMNLNELITDFKSSPEFQNIRLHHPDIKVIFSLEMPLRNIRGSSIYISKTLLNLLSNAAESIRGKGRITVSTGNINIEAPQKVYRQTIRKGNYITLSIEDTGSGISEKDLPRIFEPFYTKKMMGRRGTGLEMPVLWGTVKDHKGYIGIETTEGRGTNFTLYFPVTDAPATEKKSRTISRNTETYYGKGESILIVDDVPEQREIACAILERLGYSVCAVSSGEEAIDYIKKNHADLILLDMIMDPGIDGLETYKIITGFKPLQKIIISSGYSETDKVREIQHSRGIVYLKKPYSMNEIGKAVREELRKNEIPSM